MKKRGLPRKLYVDNGPSFRAHRLQLGCASLEVALKYAKPYRPQGKGKIDWFFRSVRTDICQHRSHQVFVTVNSWGGKHPIL
jgi:putative transposase